MLQDDEYDSDDDDASSCTTCSSNSGDAAVRSPRGAPTAPKQATVVPPIALDTHHTALVAIALDPRIVQAPGLTSSRPIASPDASMGYSSTASLMFQSARSEADAQREADTHALQLQVHRVIKKGRRRFSDLEYERYTAHPPSSLSTTDGHGASMGPPDLTLPPPSRLVAVGPQKFSGMIGAMLAVYFVVRLKKARGRVTQFEHELHCEQHIEALKLKKRSVLSKKFFGASTRSMNLHVAKQRSGMRRILVAAVRESDMRTSRAKTTVGGDAPVLQRSTVLQHQEDALFDRHHYEDRGGTASRGGRSLRQAIEAESKGLANAILADPNNLDDDDGSAPSQDQTLSRYLFDRDTNAASSAEASLNTAPSTRRRARAATVTSKSGTFDASGVALERSLGDTLTGGSRVAAPVPVASLTVGRTILRGHAGDYPPNPNVFVHHAEWIDLPFRDPFIGNAPRFYTYATQATPSELHSFTRTVVPKKPEAPLSLHRAGTVEAAQSRVSKWRRALYGDVRELAADDLDFTSSTFVPFALHAGMEHSRFMTRSIAEVQRLIEGNDVVFPMKRAQIMDRQFTVTHDPVIDLHKADQRVKLEVQEHQAGLSRAYAMNWYRTALERIETASGPEGVLPAIQETFAIFLPLFRDRRFERADFFSTADGLDTELLMDLASQFALHRLKGPFGVTESELNDYLHNSRGARVGLLTKEFKAHQKHLGLLDTVVRNRELGTEAIETIQRTTGRYEEALQAAAQLAAGALPSAGGGRLSNKLSARAVAAPSTARTQANTNTLAVGGPPRSLPGLDPAVPRTPLTSRQTGGGPAVPALPRLESAMRATAFKAR